MATVLAEGILRFCQEIEGDDEKGASTYLNLGAIGKLDELTTQKIVEKILKHYSYIYNYFYKKIKNEKNPKYYSVKFQGTLAEIAAIESDAQRTANNQDVIQIANKTKKTGESFRDVTKEYKVESGENIKYGYNIKHYIRNTSASSSISLYKKEESVNIFSNAAYRYFDAGTLIALRYISANYNFFKDMSLNISMHNE